MGDLNKGWIKLSRSALDNELLRDPICMAVWVRLILLANYEDNEDFSTRKHGYKIPIKRGQLFTSYGSLALQTGTSVWKVRHALDRFSSKQMLTKDNKQDGILITLVNYEKFQCSVIQDRTQNRTQNSTQDAEKTATNKEELTTEEVKEKKTMPSADDEGGEMMGEELMRKYGLL